MNDRIEMINLDLIEPHPANRRVGGFDQAKLEQLAESIKSVGVQQPAIVRRIESVNGSVVQYQLVAGERRWRASRIAGNDSLPCIVRELDDITALKIQTIENLQRDDIHPLDEAEGYHQLIDQAGYTVESIAADVGKSASYVYQRMKLTSLVEEVRQLFADGKITAGHAILIARLGPDQQHKILKDRLFRHGGTVASVRDLDEYIHDNILLDLSKTTWKKEDANLFPTAGSCKDCIKRTGYNPALFADVCKNGKQKDYCIDEKCFRNKQDLVVQTKKKELAGEDFVEVVDGYMYGSDVPKNVLHHHEWHECKKSEPGAKRVLVVAGNRPGRLTYGVVPDKGNGQRYQQSAEEKAKAKKERDAERTAQNKRIDKVNNVLQAAASKSKSLPVEALRVCLQKVWKRWWYDHCVIIAKTAGWVIKNQDASSEGLQRIKTMDEPQLNRLLLLIAMSDEIKVHSYHGPDTITIDALGKIFSVSTKPKTSSSGKKKTAKKK